MVWHLETPAYCFFPSTIDYCRELSSKNVSASCFKQTAYSCMGLAKYKSTHHCILGKSRTKYSKSSYKSTSLNNLPAKLWSHWEVADCCMRTGEDRIFLLDKIRNLYHSSIRHTSAATWFESCFAKPDRMCRRNMLLSESKFYWEAIMLCLWLLHNHATPYTTMLHLITLF